MIIDKTTEKELIMRVFNLCELLLGDASAIIEETEEGKKLSGYYKYPKSRTEGFYKKQEYEDVVSECDYLRYRIPKYTMTSLPDSMINYNAVFAGYGTHRLVDLEQYDEYKSLKSFIEGNVALERRFKNEDSKDCRYAIKDLIQRIVIRYLFKEKPVGSSEKVNAALLDEIIIESLNFFIAERLDVDYYVPICMATFEEKRIELSDQIEIVEIPEEYQMARQAACTYEDSYEDGVASCATHMVLIHRYCLDNSKQIRLQQLNNINSYPLEEIDSVFGIIRLVTGCSVGYEQVLCRPINWLHRFCGDLPAVYGAKGHGVQPEFLEQFWLLLRVSVISSDECDTIKKIYNAFKKCEEKVRFPLNRLNRCMLRRDVDDATADACIGLEAVLAGGTMGEITYTISNRVPIVFTKQADPIISPENSRKILKKIYNYRSKIVHGVTLKEKDKFYDYLDNKYYIPELAIKMLRHTLIFVILNPEYLNPNKIDEFIDNMFALQQSSGA